MARYNIDDALGRSMMVNGTSNGARQKVVRPLAYYVKVSRAIERDEGILRQIDLIGGDAFPSVKDE